MVINIIRLERPSDSLLILIDVNMCSFDFYSLSFNEFLCVYQSPFRRVVTVETPVRVWTN